MSEQERPGVTLALDWGEARIGVAACDRDGLLSYPVETVQAGPRALDRLAQLLAEYEPVRVVVGLPRSLSGREGPAATRIRGHAAEFASVAAVPVLLVDERMTTVGAAKSLRAAGRTAKNSRGVIDQAAAVAILDGALERVRRGLGWPGTVLSTTTQTPSSPEEDR